jgi:2-phospho-L-lactate guanylyltransferase
VKVCELPSLGLDVDTPGDLAALRAALAARPGPAPRTRALLADTAPAAA